MLYVLSTDPNTFETLSRLGVFNFDFIYLSHHEFLLSAAEKYFLEQVSPRYIVLNQRERLDEFLSDLKKLVHCQILSIEELGALEFINSKEGLTYKHYRVDTAAQFQYLITT